MSSRYKLAAHASMHTFDLISSAVPAALQLALAILMLRHKDYRRYPFFFAYTIYSIVVTIARLWVMKQAVLFFVLSYATEAGYGLLALLCIAEVFRPTLELVYERWRWLRYLLLPLMLLVLAGIGVWQGVYHPVGRGPLVHMAAGIHAFVIGVRCVEAGLLLAAWGLRRTGWMAMAERPFAVLTGFGLAALVSVAAYFARYHFGAGLEEAFRYMPISAYILSSWWWLRAFIHAEPPHTREQPDPEKVQRLIDLVHDQRRMLKKMETACRAPGQITALRRSASHDDFQIV